nr:MAG: putative coat protein [Tombusviridae sp.]
MAKQNRTSPMVEVTSRGTVSRLVPKPRSRKGMATDMGGQRFATVKAGPMRVRSVDSSTLEMERTEAFGSVIASPTAGQFAVSVRPFYPMSGALQWIRNFANSYSSYEVLKMEFTYVPSVPTTTAGSVALAFFTDFRDNTPTNMAQMLSTEQSLLCPCYAGSDGGTFLQRFGAPSNNVVSFTVPDHVIKYADGTPKMFKICTDASFASMQSVATAGDAIVATYSPGELLVATEGATTASQTLGQIFVRYRIRLKGPVPVSVQS